ncbi:hypothetical protein L7F22_039615 [Adiantum nelumboides]|nr:hypothetical protein [Adiantum nelumboides]
MAAVTFIIIWDALLLSGSSTLTAIAAENVTESPPAHTLLNISGYDATRSANPVAPVPSGALAHAANATLVPSPTGPVRQRHPHHRRRQPAPSVTSTSPALAPASATGKRPVWCVAKPDASEDLLVAGLFHVCYQKAGFYCLPLMPTGYCFTPNVPRLHASFAFNSYWQFHCKSGFPCDFDGAAHLVYEDPSECLLAALLSALSSLFLHGFCFAASFAGFGSCRMPPYNILH